MNVSENVTGDEFHDATLSTATKIAFVSWSVIAVLIKISLICVCLKALAKTFHHLSVLCILVSDVCLSLSTSTYSMSRNLTNTSVCLFEVFLVFYFLLLNYSFLFLICVHRFVVLKTCSFGAAKQRFENYKYWIITGTVTIPFFYQLGDSLLMPIQESIHSCSAPILYGEFQPLFIGLNIVPITTFMILIVVLYAVGSRIIWKRFLQTTPFNGTTQQKLETTGGEDTIVIDITLDYMKSGRNLVVDEPELSINDISISSVEASYSTFKPLDNIVSAKATKGHVKQVSDKFKTKHNVDTSCVRHEIASGECTSKLKDNLLKHTDMKVQKLSSTNGMDVTAQTKNENAEIVRESSINVEQKCAKISWEIRAFFTCLLIAVQTVLLTGPIIYGFWVDVVTRNPSSLQFKFILSFPYLLAGLINLFVYTWRFQEIRKELRRLCCRKN